MRNDKVKVEMVVLEGASFDEIDNILGYAINGKIKRTRETFGKTKFEFYCWTTFIREVVKLESKKIYLIF